MRRSAWRAHRRAADALLQAGALPEQAAAHLVQTLPDSDPVVVVTLRQAARRSLAQGAPDAAAAYLGRALEEPPEPSSGWTCSTNSASPSSTATRPGAEHLRQAVALLADAADRPDIVLAYSHALIATDRAGGGDCRPPTTSDRIRDLDRDRHLRLEARLIVGAQFEPAFHDLRRERLEEAREGELESGTGAALVLAQWALEEARRGVSRERAIDYALRAQTLGALAETEELLFAMNSLYALALAGEVDEAARALTAAIADAQRQGDALEPVGVLSGQGNRALGARRPPRRRRGPADGRIRRMAGPSGRARGISRRLLLEQGRMRGSRRMRSAARPRSARPGSRCIFSRRVAA